MLSYTIQESQEKKGILIRYIILKRTKLHPIASTVSWFIIGNIKLDSVVHTNIKCEKISQILSFPKMKNTSVHINKTPIKKGRWMSQNYFERNLQKKTSTIQ